MIEREILGRFSKSSVASESHSRLLVALCLVIDAFAVLDYGNFISDTVPKWHRLIFARRVLYTRKRQEFLYSHIHFSSSN